jgi:hypothetical protein
LEGALPTIRIANFSLFDIHIYWIFGLIFAVYLVQYHQKFEYSTPLALLGGFVVYCLMTLLWTADFAQSVQSVFLMISAGTIIVAVPHLVKDKQEYHLLIYTFFSIIIVTIFIAFWEYWTGVHLPISRLSDTPGVRASAMTGVFINQNYLVFLLSIAVPLFIWKGLQASSVWVRLFILGILLSIFWIILYNGGRAGFIASLLGTGATLVFWYLKPFMRKIPFWPPLLTNLIALVVFLTLFLPKVMSNPFNKSSSFSIWSRWQLLDIAGNMIISKPHGYGFGAFPAVSAHSIIDTGRIIYPHSWVAQLAGEVGLFGLIIFVLAYGLLADRLFSAYLKGDNGYSLPLTISLLAFAVASLGTGNPLHSSRIFWTLYAIALGYFHVIARHPS